jgi:hypothetical protein
MTRRTISTLAERRRGHLHHRGRFGRQYFVIAVGVACCFGLLSIIWEKATSTTAAATRRTTVQSVRAEFYNRYGGKQASEDMLARGVKSFGSIKATAERMLRSAANDHPFVLSFAGYSVTVGRGNYYSQSFPFVLERIIAPLLESMLHLPVKVHNAAIGGIPSFPYAFCFEHFLSSDPHVISWDFSMNEGKGAAVLESYLRHSQHQLQNRPMVILLDTNKQRCELLKQYTDQGLLADAVCVGMAEDAVADTRMLLLPDDQKPIGFQHWQEFGAPPQCPGRGSWHPKKMEHELIGWLLSMYFVQAVEEALKITKADIHWMETYNNDNWHESAAVSFPKPLVTPLPENSQQVTDLLFGHTLDDETYTLKKLSCRTNFLPATDQEKVLPSIVVSGLSPSATAANIMKERGQVEYHSGWVLDVSNVERDTKVKVDECGGLGYVDLKSALYGVPESGSLRLWLPMEGPSHGDHGHANADDMAKHWFDEVVVCEANEKRPEAACHLDTDIDYTVGGVLVESPTMIAGAAEYLKRKTCVHVGVPPGATITRLRNVQSKDGSPLTSEGRRRLAIHKNIPLSDDHVGLIVEVKARSNVSMKNGACCVSHIVWEQH